MIVSIMTRRRTRVCSRRTNRTGSRMPRRRAARTASGTDGTPRRGAGSSPALGERRALVVIHERVGLRLGSGVEVGQILELDHSETTREFRPGPKRDDILFVEITLSSSLLPHICSVNKGEDGSLFK